MFEDIDTTADLSDLAVLITGMLSASMIYTYYLGEAGIRQMEFLGSGQILGIWSSPDFWLLYQTFLLCISISAFFYFRGVRE